MSVDYRLQYAGTVRCSVPLALPRIQRIQRFSTALWPKRVRADYVGAVKRALALVVVAILVGLLGGLLSWIALSKRSRTLPSDAIQIRLLGTNSTGQLQFWATNRSDRRVHVALRDVQVKREQEWVTDQYLLNPGKQFVLDPYSTTQGVLTFSKSMPQEAWRLQGLTVEELDGAARLVEYAKLKLKDLKAGTTSKIPTTPAQGGPFFKYVYSIQTESVTNGQSAIHLGNHPMSQRDSGN